MHVSSFYGSNLYLPQELDKRTLDFNNTAKQSQHHVLYIEDGDFNERKTRFMSISTIISFFHQFSAPLY